VLAIVLVSRSVRVRPVLLLRYQLNCGLALAMVQSSDCMSWVFGLLCCLCSELAHSCAEIARCAAHCATVWAANALSLWSGLRKSSDFQPKFADRTEIRAGAPDGITLPRKKGCVGMQSP